MKWIRTSRLSIKNSLSPPAHQGEMCVYFGPKLIWPPRPYTSLTTPRTGPQRPTTRQTGRAAATVWPAQRKKEREAPSGCGARGHFARRRRRGRAVRALLPLRPAVLAPAPCHIRPYASQYFRQIRPYPSQYFSSKGIVANRSCPPRGRSFL